MSYLHRVTPNKNTTAEIEGVYNKKGQLLDANTKEVLVEGNIDRGHKHGYEERVMRECAERCHMTQKEYSQMMQNAKLYQFESSHNNRTHKYESNNRNQQLHNCFEVIRDFKGKNRNRAIEKYGKSDFTYSKQSNAVKSLKAVSKSNSNQNATAKSSGFHNGNHSHGQSTAVGKASVGSGKSVSTGSGHSGSSGGHSGSSGGHSGSSGGHSGSSGGHSASGGSRGGLSGGHSGSGGGHSGSGGGHGGSGGGHGGSGGGHGR